MMQILLDCIPCMLKQALEASRLATNNVKIQEEIIKESLEILSDYKSYRTSPELARAIHLFQKKLTKAKTILIIGDNTGETIFDKVLIENIPEIEVTYALRSEPIINDATMEDAVASGLDKVADLISSGCNAPGLILEECSAEFLAVYNNAEIIISKGQGNYEALSEEKNIFFLLKAKCPMIAGRLNVKLNEYILKYSEGEKND